MTAALLLVVSSSAGFGATLEALQGDVMINAGDGFRRVAGSATTNPGDYVMVGPGGKAQLVFPSGVVVPVEEGNVVAVAEEPPLFDPNASVTVTPTEPSGAQDAGSQAAGEPGGTSTQVASADASASTVAAPGGDAGAPAAAGPATAGGGGFFSTAAGIAVGVAGAVGAVAGGVALASSSGSSSSVVATTTAASSGAPASP